MLCLLLLAGSCDGEGSSGEEGDRVCAECRYRYEDVEDVEGDPALITRVCLWQPCGLRQCEQAYDQTYFDSGVKETEKIYHCKLPYRDVPGVEYRQGLGLIPGLNGIDIAVLFENLQSERPGTGDVSLARGFLHGLPLMLDAVGAAIPAGKDPVVRVGVLTTDMGSQGRGITPQCADVGDDGRLIACGAEPSLVVEHNLASGDLYAALASLECRLLAEEGTGCGWEMPFAALARSVERGSLGPLFVGRHLHVLHLLLEEDDCSIDDWDFLSGLIVSGQVNGVTCIDHEGSMLYPPDLGLVRSTFESLASAYTPFVVTGLLGSSETPVVADVGGGEWNVTNRCDAYWLYADPMPRVREALSASGVDHDLRDLCQERWDDGSTALGSTIGGRLFLGDLLCTDSQSASVFSEYACALEVEAVSGTSTLEYSEQTGYSFVDGPGEHCPRKVQFNGASSQFADAEFLRGEIVCRRDDPQSEL